jgi:Photosynthesis system II assembly factor YCF48/Putative zinc-finger
MTELSNLLRHRLGAQQDALGEHPDADLLTAFAERSLPLAERQQMLKHLSACADCREVLALSQSAVLLPETQAVLTPAAVPFWRRLFTPAFGLAGSIAAIAVVAVLVLEHPQQREVRPSSSQEAKASASIPDQDTASKNAPAAQPAPQEQAGTARSIAGLEAAKARNERVVASGQADLAGSISSKVAAQRNAAAPQPVLTAGVRKKDFLNNAFFETSEADVAAGGQPSAPPPQGYSSDATFKASVPGQITIFSDIPANTASNKSNMQILTPPPPRDRFGTRWGKTVVQGARGIFGRPPSSVPAIGANALASSAMDSKLSSEIKRQPADAGAIAAAPKPEAAAGLEGTEAFSARAMAPGARMESAAWKVAGGKLLKASGSQWEEAYPGASFQFTFVNAHGSEVWAGGSDAALIHSRNGGETWESARLGEAASGFIVSIVFLGNNVQVKTSDDQSWSSSDGGKSWTKN